MELVAVGVDRSFVRSFSFRLLFASALEPPEETGATRGVSRPLVVVGFFRDGRRCVLVQEFLEPVHAVVRIEGVPVGQIVKGGLAGKGHRPQVGDGGFRGSPVVVVQAKQERTVRRDGFHHRAVGTDRSSRLLELAGVLALLDYHGGLDGPSGTGEGKGLQLLEVPVRMRHVLVAGGDFFRGPLGQRRRVFEERQSWPVLVELGEIGPSHVVGLECPQSQDVSLHLQDKLVVFVGSLAIVSGSGQLQKGLSVLQNSIVDVNLFGGPHVIGNQEVLSVFHDLVRFGVLEVPPPQGILLELGLNGRTGRRSRL
mmetsp:Transcript_17406/g.40174  ORF Transcript_17406/g.40174 Transcript_17406/m.40174 type:complete len:311 (+) Transcript_17406:186-1118(+)